MLRHNAGVTINNFSSDFNPSQTNFKVVMEFLHPPMISVVWCMVVVKLKQDYLKEGFVLSLHYDQINQEPTSNKKLQTSKKKEMCGSLGLWKRRTNNGG